VASMINKRTFLKSFLKNPGRTGSVIQSSPFLVKKMTDPVDWQNARLIVEFGAGTGVITEKILEKMTEDATLLCIEIDAILFDKLKKRIKDPRIKLIQDGAENLGKYLKKYKLGEVDYIISGLPLVSLPKKTSTQIVVQILKYLKKGGKYIQFQYSLVSRKEFKSLFSEMRVCFTPLNIPPAFVYVCTR
jgi:phospholipid N-methyltransferase